MSHLLKLCFFFALLLPATSWAQATRTQRPKAAAPLKWQENRKLTWADFQAKAFPSDTKYALTTSDMKVGIACDGDAFSFTVEALFIPSESWTRSLSSDALLAHEQLHFDLTELHARKLRKTFAMLPAPCLVPEKEMQKLIDQAFADWHQMQEDYDHATNHGLNKEAQAAWQKLISAGLAQFAAVQ